jgi:hypothetical protein
MDSYTLSARIYPTLLITSPLIAAIHSWLPEAVDFKLLLPTLAGTGLLSMFLAQIGRDKGKEIEKALFKEWGGSSTTRQLRHRQTSNPILLARHHSGLGQLLGISMPTVEEEEDNPAVADQNYEAASKFLRNATRNKDTYSLIYKENVNYGFRRNLFAMKNAGIAIATASALSCVGAGTWYLSENKSSTQPFLLFGIACVWLTWLLLRVNKSWIKLAADAYSERLLESIDSLDPRAPSSPSSPSTSHLQG